MKQLIIKLKGKIREGNREIWNNLEAPENFVNDIETPEVETKDTSIDHVVSGLPNPFARAIMLQYAIEAAVDNETNTDGGMMAYYQALRDEWKGLIGCIALDSAPISIHTIPLAYADGRGFASTRSLFEVGGALGNMLFEDRKYWCDEAQWRTNPAEAVPLIHIVRYHDTIIGATAPKSLFFTPPSYSIKPQVPFYIHDRFQDPLQSELTPSQTQILYTYVDHICNNFNRYHATLIRDGAAPQIGALLSYLTNWKNEIKTYGLSRGYQIQDNSIATNIKIFPAPYDTLFNTTVTLYGFNGQISRTPVANYIPFDPSELLVPHASSTVVRIVFEDGFSPDQNAAYLVPATSEKGTVYFSIPLSEKGILIFQNDLDRLLYGIGSNSGSRILAEYDAAANTAKVQLHLLLDGQTTVIQRTYRNPPSISSHKIILWPNFYSPAWSSYFYYSELPHNGNNSLQLYPLQADLGNYLLLNNGETLNYLIDPHSPRQMADTAKFMVQHVPFFNSSPLQYEIIQSDLPIKGVELRYTQGTMTNQLAGYIIAQSRNNMDPHKIENRGAYPAGNQAVKVGFDFGSNNICVSYADAAGGLNLLRFENRRRYLVGTVQPAAKERPAKPHQVFFFQERAIDGNQVKSMIMTHDLRRLPLSDAGTPYIGEQISGGLPVFELNLPVENSTDTVHEVNFGQVEAKIKYNLKWSTSAEENDYKHAMLKTLWLKVQAELFVRNLSPSDLKWAYPSAMNRDTIQGYFNLWQNVVQTTGYSSRLMARPAPFDSTDPEGALTESEAVCNFALTAMGQMQLRPNYLMFGFDVGGSTTDILCIESQGQPTLVKQSSVRLSAGLLADATKRSPNIRAALQDFCAQQRLSIYGINTQLNSSTAPYFFNAILDQLSIQGDQALGLFYSNLYARGCKDIFVVNAYITGLLFFYSGQLAAKVIHDLGLAHINHAQFGFYGKGGRMFDWLPAIAGGAAQQYFEACFYEGLGKREGFGIEINRRNINVGAVHHVKSEVSFGLAATRRVNVMQTQLYELIGEEGFEFHGQVLPTLADVRSEIFQHIGGDLKLPNEFVQFKKFLRLFNAFARQQFGLHLEGLLPEVDKMKLINYIINLPEYIAAQNIVVSPEVPFGFEAPMIVLEGMCFLKDILMEKVFK